MNVKVFSLYDSKAEAFGSPVMYPTEGMAVRALKDVVNDSKTTVGQHPEDYIMYQIADYDDSKGEFINQIPVKLIVAAITLQKPNKQMELPLIQGGDLIKDMLEKAGKNGSDKQEKSEVKNEAI